jgi:hypothetical protein
VVVESSSEEEEEDSSKCDVEDMALFMKKFKKYIKKRTCYNCDKHDHFIANFSFECMDDDDDKKKSKPYKKKSCGEAHIGQ